MKKILALTTLSLILSGCFLIPGSRSYLFGTKDDLDYTRVSEEAFIINAVREGKLSIAGDVDLTLISGNCEKQQVSYGLTCNSPSTVQFKTGGDWSATIYGPGLKILAGPMRVEVK